MPKRQRTPHFITGLGDGHVGRDDSNQAAAAAKKHLTGLRHPSTTKIHSAAATDDIFQVTRHTRNNQRNNNNNNINDHNNNNLNNRYHLRTTSTITANERLARMEMDDGKESRWDIMFSSSSSNDGRGKSNSFAIPTGIRGAEKWELSAIAMVAMIVFLSALFLHMVSDSSSSSSSSSGGSSSHHHQNYHGGSRHNNKFRSIAGGAKKRIVSSGTRKKKTDEWSSDEEGSIEEIPPADSDVQAAVAGTPNRNMTNSNKTTTTAKPALFYPHQPRHRKPSAGGCKEAMAGVAYSPAAHSRNYYLNPMDGPVMPSYQQHQSPVAARTTLSVASLNPSYTTATTTSQQQQEQPSPLLSQSKVIQATSPAGGSLAAGLSSPPQPQRPVVSNFENEFMATGLESFQPQQPAGTMPTTPQIQRRAHEMMMTPKADTLVETDEESQHHHSDFQPNSPAMNPAAAVALQNQSYTHTSGNPYMAYGKTTSFNSDHSSSLSDSNYRQGSGSQHQALERLSGHSSNRGLLSPRANIDISLDETPRIGCRRTVALGNQNGSMFDPSNNAHNSFAGAQQRGKQQPFPTLQSKGGNNSGSNDPFRALRLPMSEAMGNPYRYAGRQQTQEQQGQQQNLNVPFIPKLDLAAAVAMAEQNQLDGTGPPRSMSIEGLHLVRMESGTHWQVKSSTESPTEDVVTELPNLSTSSGNKKTSPHGNKAPNPFHASAGLGSADDVFSVASSSTQEYAIDSGDEGPKNGIVHKRESMIQSTDAASSLRSSIKFDELKLDEVVGGGGFGQVWKAEWRGTPVAVKVLTGSAQAKHVSKAVLEEFAAEINLLSGMRHPNVCLYMGACVDPPNRAIITELAAHGSLWDALRLPLDEPFHACDGKSREYWPSELYDPGQHGLPPSSSASYTPPIPTAGSWPWALVRHVALGAARGMAYLHSGNPPILHRDLKSANILLSESYTAKVCDFGLSRLKAQERSMTGNCGTVQWMAVEVLAQQSYGEKADVYSYGIICIELLTRECPYDGMSAIQCALAVLNRDQRPAIPRWCPPALRVLIKSCIKKDPDERPTFSQIISALDAMPS